MKRREIIALSVILGILFSGSAYIYTSSLGIAEKSEDIPINLTEIPDSAALRAIGTSALLQGFYWDVPAGGIWYDEIASRAQEIADAGFDCVWFPPPSKAMNGPYSMGYDPYDYYDLGQYNQKGSVETRFGSVSELETAIDLLKSYGVHTMADIVINHNGGGDLQYNPNVGYNTWTDFSNVASGMFLRGYNDFHVSTYEYSDEGTFGGYPDLCHANPWVYNNLIDWGKWLRDDIGFTDWRFDYTKGYHSWMVKEWMYQVGGFGVGEYWDSNRNLLQNWVAGTDYQASTFDFNLYYTLRDMCLGDGYFDMSSLDGAGYVSWDPMHAVTFVANHDTDEIWKNKEMAYAYIMMAEGYPSVFWRDYFEWGMKDLINTLMWVRMNFVGGSTTVLYKDQDLFIMQRNGWDGKPGAILMLNDNANSWKGQWVQTKFGNTRLVDATGQANDEYTQWNGWVELWAPPSGFTVWIPQ